MTPSNKGISLTGINILNQYSFKDFSNLVEILKKLVLKLEGNFYTLNYPFSEELRQALTTQEMKEMRTVSLNKDELVENINKLSKILNDLSVDNEYKSYILIWFGV